MTLAIGTLVQPRRFVRTPTSPYTTTAAGNRVWNEAELLDCAARRTSLGVVLREADGSPYAFSFQQWDGSQFVTVTEASGPVYVCSVRDIDLSGVDPANPKGFVEATYPLVHLIEAGTRAEVYEQITGTPATSVVRAAYAMLPLEDCRVSARYIDGDALPEDVAAIRRSVMIASI